MRATLSFKLPEENSEFETASRAVDYKMALQDLDEMLRQRIKYGTNLSKEEIRVTQVIRDTLYEILVSRDINLF